MIGQFIQGAQKKYINRSYEHRGRVKTILYTNLFLLPSFLVILIGMNLLASRSLFDTLNLVIFSFITIILIGIALIYAGYYNAAVNIFVFAVAIGLIINSYGTALKGSPERFVASFLPWIVTIIYATLFCTIRVVSAVVIIQIAGYIAMIYSITLINPATRGIVFFDALITIFLSSLISFLGIRITLTARNLRKNETELETLPNIDINIKCGNSLIESKSVAGDKAFSWKEQFPEVFEKGGFDVIIGNPPYQLSDGGYRVSASPIYQNFVQQAKKLNPRYLSMIIPSRWFSGGKGLDEFRDDMLNDNRIRAIHDYPEATDCFPGVQIKGGICYFLWDRDNKGKCMVVTHRGSMIGVPVERALLEDGNDVFIRYNEAIGVIQKVQQFHEASFERLVSARKPFGFDTLYRGKSNGTILLYQNGGTAYVTNSEIGRNLEWVEKDKVFIPEAGSGSDSFPHSILGKATILQ